jgi:hypothetical protein
MALSCPQSKFLWQNCEQLQNALAGWEEDAFFNVAFGVVDIFNVFLAI